MERVRLKTGRVKLDNITKQRYSNRSKNYKKFDDEWVDTVGAPKLQEIIDNLNIDNIIEYHTFAALCAKLGMDYESFHTLKRKNKKFSDLVNLWQPLKDSIYDLYAHKKKMNPALYIYVRSNFNKLAQWTRYDKPSDDRNEGVTVNINLKQVEKNGDDKKI